MVGHQRPPWVSNPSTGANVMTPAKQELEISCPNIRKPTMSQQLCTIVSLSTLCFVLLVTCVAFGFLYSDESDNKLERSSLLSDRQNISDHYLAVTKENTELERDNQNLKEHNARLGEQTQLLNRSLAKLTSMSGAIALENTHLQEQVENLTQTNLQLTEDHEHLVQYSAEQEETRLNMTRSIAYLTHSHTRLEEETQRLFEMNTSLRDELFQVKQQNEEVLELNAKFQGEIQTLNEKVEADAFLRDDCEEASGNNTSLQETVGQLRAQNKNLSALLERERRREAEREESSEEMDRMRLTHEAYGALDLYCPVVNQKTHERICKKCPDSWTLFQSKCYYFSSRTLPWSSSRAWCRTQGGDLVVINSEQEQTFVFSSSQAVDQSSVRVWIGMTDTEEEGEWHWVDGSPVTSDLQYWLSRVGKGTEPDDWKVDNPLGEDCGHIDSSETALSSWMDGSCEASYRWICEKNV